MADRNGIVQRAPLPPLNSPLINERIAPASR
jgi:hypothetical protein